MFQRFYHFIASIVTFRNTFFAFLFACFITTCMNQTGDLDAALMSLAITNQNQITIFEQRNQKLLEEIDSTAYFYSNPINRQYLYNANQIYSTLNHLYLEVENIKQDLIAKGGGRDAQGFVRDYKNCDISYQYFHNTSIIKDLSTKIDTCLSVIRNNFSPRDYAEIEKNLTLAGNLHARSFYQNDFRGASLAMTLAQLSNLQNDIKITETTCLFYIYRQVHEIKFCDFNRFLVAISPNELGVVRGETHGADVALGSYYMFAYDSMKVKINGKYYYAKDDVVRFQEKANTLGTHDMNVEIQYYKYIYKKGYILLDKFNKKTTYEVVAPMLHVDNKTNKILYKDIPQIFEVNMAEENFENLKFTAKNLIVNKIGDGKIEIVAIEKGQASLRVAGRLFAQNFIFKVKNLPTPQVSLVGIDANNITAQNFQQHHTLQAEIKDFDHQVPCEINNFTFHYIPQNEDEIELTNSGAIFSTEIQKLQSKAKIGDLYFITNVQATCANQTMNHLNTLVFPMR